MKLRGDIVQAVAGAILLSVALHFGFLKPDGPFLTNMVTGLVIYGASKIVALVFG